MEGSCHSSMCKDVLNSKEIKPADECSEESGWTAYFEDFSNHINIDNNDEQSLCSSFDESPSLVSDAATNGAWGNISHNKHVNIPKSPIRLSFMKTKSRELFGDDSLEDTASSPVNSPKIADLRPVGRNTPRKADNYQEKGGHISQYYSELQPEKTSIVDNFNGKNDSIDLKNRGLCLVPMSMLAKYLG